MGPDLTLDFAVVAGDTWYTARNTFRNSLSTRQDLEHLQVRLPLPRVQALEVLL